MSHLADRGADVVGLRSTIRTIRMSAMKPRTVLFYLAPLLSGLFLTLASGVALADADDIVVRQLSLDTTGIKRLVIDSGPGDLIVKGQADAGEITVEAAINVSPAYDGADPDGFVDEYVLLTLERRGRAATLTASMPLGLGMSHSPEIDIEVTVPSNIEIEIEDESGVVRISGLSADLSLQNGPGNIQITDVDGQVLINDTAGRIVVENIRADVEINDRSGSITVRDIDGTVFVSDSSGNITAEGITQDLVIEQDTSGKVHTRDIGGKVVRNDQ